MPASIDQLARARPMLDVWAACALLDLQEDAVMARIEDGRIGLAFDISSESARKATVRIFTPCLHAMLAGEPAAPWPLDRALGQILPGKSATIPAARALNCSSSHVMNLLAEGSLRAAAAKRHRTASPFVTRISVLNFLSERRFS
jgi:hypothetical protein